MYTIGYDIGSSSVKAALVDLASGEAIHVAQYPKIEMAIHARKEGWAEQDPETWWNAVLLATKELFNQTEISPKDVKSIGISYQMHGLVCVDQNQNVLRPSIIWCDSRAVEIGEMALKNLGHEYCLSHLLNSPGNFTASKLRWVKENEPEIFEKIYKIMLPGDYIAMKLTGEINTSITSLSEGMLWDYKENRIASRLMEHFEIPSSFIPEIKETFSIQGLTHTETNELTGIPKGTPVSYRAGDQPNNALSLGVFQPGDVAATGGTSGVVYGISDTLAYDSFSRVNGFAHVNHAKDNIRIGQLLCINGAGSQYAWIRAQIASQGMNYTDMEDAIKGVPIGAEGLRIIPFGNGAERVVQNKQTGAQINNLQFNIHSKKHLFKAALEGIAFSFYYGIKVLQEIGIDPKIMKVGNDNLFQSHTFSITIANLMGCDIEMIKTTGAVGAAKASAVAIGYYNSPDEAISTTKAIHTYRPTDVQNDAYQNAYHAWANDLKILLNR